MKVENLNGYTNQFLITDREIITFQSYNSKIAEYNRETNTLKVFKDWDYSKTTMRHFKVFINENTSFYYENSKQWRKEMENNNNIQVEE